MSSSSQPITSKGCLKTSNTNDSNSQEKKDRRVSFFEKTHVRQVFYRKSLSGRDSLSQNAESNSQFTIPDITTTRRKSGSIFGLHFDQNDKNEENLTDVSTSFEQESFEIPTKGAADDDDHELNEGECEMLPIRPDLDDSSLADFSMQSNESSLESPTGSDIIHIRNTMMSLTPIKNPTPLRQSFTLDDGWTTDMSIPSIKFNQSMIESSQTSSGQQQVERSHAEEDDTVDMDLTEPISALVEVNRRRSSIAPNRLSTASAMDITTMYGGILDVNDNSQPLSSLPSSQKDAVFQSPVRKSPRLSSGGRRESVAPPRMSTASAMDITTSYGQILNVQKSESTQNSPHQPGNITSDFKSFQSSPIRKKAGTGSTPQNSVNKTPEKSQLSSRASTPASRIYTSSRLSSPKVGSSSLVSTINQAQTSNNDASRSPVRSSPRRLSKPSSSAKVTPKKSFEVIAKAPEVSSPITRSKSKLFKSDSMTSNCSSHSSGPSTSSELFQSSQVSDLESKIIIAPSEVLVSSQIEEEVIMPNENEWIENVSFHEPDFDITKTIQVEETVHATAPSVPVTPKPSRMITELSDDNDYGRISIVATPMKVASKTLTAAFSKYLDDEEVPEMDFPQFQPSVFDEHSKLEIENCEKLITEWNYLLERDVQMVDMLLQEFTNSSELLFSYFENDYEGFLSMLEVAHKDSTVGAMQDIMDNRLELFDIYSQMVSEYERVIGENLEMQKSTPINVDQIIKPVVDVLKERQEEHEKLISRYNEVNKLSSEEYEEAMQFCHQVKEATENAESLVKTLDQEIEQLDERFGKVLNELESARIAKSNIKFDYEDLPENDDGLGKARDNYDLITKLSCWSIKDVSRHEIRLDYRQGFAEVSLARDGKVVDVKSKSLNSVNVESMKQMSIASVWNCLDNALCSI